LASGKRASPSACSFSCTALAAQQLPLRCIEVSYLADSLGRSPFARSFSFKTRELAQFWRDCVRIDSDQEGSLLKLLVCLKLYYFLLYHLRLKKKLIQDLILVHFLCSMLGREVSLLNF